MYELMSCAYFVNTGISNAVSKHLNLTNMTVTPVCSDDVLCVCVCVWVCQFLLKGLKSTESDPHHCLAILSQFRNNTDPTGRNLMKFCIRKYFENLSIEFDVHWTVTRIMSDALEEQNTVLMKSRRKLLRMKKFSNKFVEKNKTLLFQSINFSPNHAIYAIMWKTMLNQTGQSALCVVDNLGVSRTLNM